MHELSVALGIVKIAEEETKKAQASKVDLIEIEIGELAGVEFESLNFVWPSAVKGTVLESAEKKIIRIQAKAKCLDCDIEFGLKHFYDSCPDCGSNLKGILNGRELRVKALEVV